MENETQEEVAVQVEQKSSLHQMTPLSKYLAMALFIILPFVGGYVGYTFAPEKTVEIEKEVVREVVVDEQLSEQIDVIDPYTTESGIELDGRKLNSYTLKDFVDSEEKLALFLNELGSTYALNETFTMTGFYRTYEKSALGETQQCHGLKLQGRPTNFWHFKTLLSTLGGNSVNQIEEKSLVINLPWDEISIEDKQSIAAGEQVALEMSAQEPVFSSVGPCYSGFEFIRIIE